MLLEEVVLGECLQGAAGAYFAGSSSQSHSSTFDLVW